MPVSVRLPKAIIQALDKQAKAENRTRANMIVELLRRSLEKAQ